MPILRDAYNPRDGEAPHKLRTLTWLARWFSSPGYKDGWEWFRSGGTISNKPHSLGSVGEAYYDAWYAGYYDAVYKAREFGFIAPTGYRGVIFYLRNNYDYHCR